MSLLSRHAVTLFLLGLLIFGAALIFAMNGLASTTLPDGTVLEVYCPEDEPCPDDDVEEYVLTGFSQDEPNVIFEYWPGQVPCDQNGTTYPCPQGGAPAPSNAAIQQGVEEWGTATSSETNTDYLLLSQPPGGSVCGGVFSGLDTLKREADGRNTVMWAPLEGSVIGIACWWFQTNECDIILDNTWAGATNAENVRTVTLHESGHCLGLGHSNIAGAVMLASFSGPLHLHADDIAGFCAIYGCLLTPPPPSFTPTSSATPTPSITPTPTPSLTFRCGDRVWLVPVACKRLPMISRD